MSIRIEMCSVSTFAHNLSQEANLVYWLSNSPVDLDGAAYHEKAVHEELRKLAEALGYRVTKKDAASASAWQGIKDAPRDGRWVWLWNKHSDEPIRLRWSTNYSVFGLGGCWTDGLCTMGDGIDFDFWCGALPADYVNPHSEAQAVAQAAE